MGGIKSIVMIDDDQDDIDIFKTACFAVDSSISVRSFLSGEAALLELPALSLVPDLIFLDINMPRFNGVEVLAKLKKNCNLRIIPVIIYSTTLDKSVKSVCANLGAMKVIEKPNSFMALCNTLKSIFKSELHFI